MKTTNIITGAALLLSCSLQGSAVPAYPGMITFRQADGEEISIRRIGDEYLNMALTEDGHAILYNSATRNYEYAVLDENGIVVGIAVSSPEKRDAEVCRFLDGIDREAIETQFCRDWAAARSLHSAETTPGQGPDKVVRISYNVPTTGDRDVLVILVDFANRKFTDSEYAADPSEYYARFFHEEGFSDHGCHGSAYDYYYKSSLGKYRPRFHVLGPVQVQGNYSDYAGEGGHAYTWKMIAEAVAVAKEKYDIDFSIFDTDGDGLVDNVYCLYAGYGQADSPVSDSIWPHSYNMSSVNSEFEVDGVTVDRYTVSQQLNGITGLPVGIGTFVHEFGHVLGLADHYNNSLPMGRPNNNVGNWDVMSSGSYNDDQNCPAPFSAFERYSLGWCGLTELDTKKPGQIMMIPYMDDGECFRISVREDDKEYFIIENRQQKDWDTFLPGHGLLVWHIEENQHSWDINKPNFDQNHQMVDIVEAGRILTPAGHPGDAFPGTLDVRNFSFTDWNNVKRFGFEWVEELEDGNCWILLSDTDYKITAPTLSATRMTGTSAQLEWGGNDIARSFEIRVFDGDEEVFYHAAGEKGSVTIEGLVPETDYRATAVARLNSLSSEQREINFTTLPLQIEEYSLTVLPAREITDDSFLARWRPIPVASDYTVQLYGRTHDAQGVLTHEFTDFSSSSHNLPEGWDVTPKQGRTDNSYGNAAPSIRLRDDGARLLVSVPDEKIDSIGFWFSPSKAGVILTVEKCVDSVWHEVWSHNPDRKRELTETIDVCGADSVRLVISRAEGVTGGYIFLDDVTLHYIHDQFTPFRTYDLGPSFADSYIADSATDYAFRIENLVAGEKYAYSVRAVDGMRESPWSDVMKVEEGVTDPPLSALDKMPPGQIRNSEEDVIFNLQGFRINAPASSLPAGIYIINGNKIMISR